MASHSSVIYVEPNMLSKDLNDYFDRAPKLEDYCIAMNIEVEVSSRDSQITTDGNKDVLILQWNGKDNKSVSFMSGTKIGGYDIDGLDRKQRLTSASNLTTYYADMYVGDLIHYGTTEMLGIKSVNVQYEKSCVPIITVQFTDVRGLSLFQPTELSRSNVYDGIKGLNKENIAQSFFQCFFKMPLPKFTIYLKGFYGQPVAYVCMCDKFDTNFNSDTGDFDVTARFIGYNYSFLTDVSFDALLAAPYSDFADQGRTYWDENVANGRFFLWDKYHTRKMPMPTLYEIHKEFKTLIRTSDSGMQETTLTEEEKTHEEEIEKLQDIRKKYRQWYSELIDLLKSKFGNRYVFDFKENIGEDSEWFMVILLTNGVNMYDTDLSDVYSQFPDDFKKTNADLYASIEEYNNSGSSYKKLKNVSKDFSEYNMITIFNNCYVNKNTRKIEFGGYNRLLKLNKTLLTDRFFHYNLKGETYKDYTLSTIYGDGVNQYRHGYVIALDYSDIKRRINVLNADANKSVDEKTKEKARKEHNKNMMDKMNWYPSIENFTRVMMAHLETFMMMMYKVADECKNRSPQDVGIATGKDGEACDIPQDSKVLPPFPRVVKSEIGDDGIMKKVDDWVGSYDNGKGFIEADMINGLFNGVDIIDAMNKQQKEQEQREDEYGDLAKFSVKHPITSFDFYLRKCPYGTESDVVNNPNAFAGKVAMRMFDILSLNYFKKQYHNKFSKLNGDFIKKLGIIEAQNFHDSVDISKGGIIDILSTKSDNSVINADTIIQCVKKNVGIGGNTDIPWKSNNRNDSLFDSSFWLSRYSTNYKSYIYPIQDMSFSQMDTTLAIFNKSADNVDLNNNNIIVSQVSNGGAKKLLNSKYLSCFNTTYISDNFKRIGDTLDMVNNSPDNCYKEFYELIYKDSVFDEKLFSSMIYGQGVFRKKLGIKTKGKDCVYKIDKTDENKYVDALPIRINKITKQMICNGGEEHRYNFNSDDLDSYASEVSNGNITSWFLTECRGFNYKTGKDGKRRYSINPSKSFLLQERREEGMAIQKREWGYGSEADLKCGFFIMLLEAINYEKVASHLDSGTTFSYLPKLAVLQIGAALTTLESIEDTVSTETLSEKIVLPRLFGYMKTYLNAINKTTRISYIKYFKNWVGKNSKEIGEKIFKDIDVKKNGSHNTIACIYKIEDTDYKRVLFREDSDYINTLTNDLMSPVLITKGNVNHFKNQTSADLAFDDNVAKIYLSSFLEKLRELYGIDIEKDKGGDSVKLAKSTKKTTESMKKELYRYLKLLYDKWIPSREKNSWLYETYFETEKENGIINPHYAGHMFHFIDSFYNKIGDKLLVNPRLLSDKINAALDAHDVNTMLLGFMADIYGQNKCMLMCLQNFMDFSDRTAMNAMFKPLSYNEMGVPNKHPDFVVVYPYEPSKYLNVDNGEFNNDGFMLNDEFETPLAIKSRDLGSNRCYKIPAFGVSYGKQYQSYFKKVNVGMANSIATQQAILAKHAILRASQDSTTQTTIGQDMYDIYATQSYTCTVEMMGCAWVQPLMYFVLTNVPMFKGSYLILKVNHKITPGNMTTEFTGCRMANVANKLVEDIFTDEEFEKASNTYTEAPRHSNADVSNDCPYVEFPLEEEGEPENTDTNTNTTNKESVPNINLVGDENKDGLTLMIALTSDNENYGGFNAYAAAGIVGNMYYESFDSKGSGKRFKYDLVVEDSGLSGGLCMWNNGNLVELVEKKTENLGHLIITLPTTQEEKNKYSKKLRDLGVKTQLIYLKNTLREKKGNYIPKGIAFGEYNEYCAKAKSAKVAAQRFMKLYERPKDKDINSKVNKKGRFDSAEKFYNLYINRNKPNKPTTQTSQPNKSIEKDSYQALFDAIQKTINATNRPCELKKEYRDMILNGKRKKVMNIKQTDGNNDKLPLVFDIALMAYYDKIEELWWVIPNEDFSSNPSVIDIVVSQNPKIENRRVLLVMAKKKIEDSLKIRFGKDESAVNSSFLTSIWKRYKDKNNKEIPQFDFRDLSKDKNKEKRKEVQECETYDNKSRASDYPSKGSNSSWANSVQSMGKWYERNVHTFQKHIINLIPCGLLDDSGVRDDCGGYVSACLQYFGVFKKKYVTNSNGFNSDQKVETILRNGKFKKFPYSWADVQPYDIIAYNGHVEILAEKGEHPKSWGWGSVHDGLNGHSSMPARTGNKPKGTTYKTIWRYIG